MPLCESAHTWYEHIRAQALPNVLGRRYRVQGDATLRRMPGYLVFLKCDGCVKDDA